MSQISITPSFDLLLHDWHKTLYLTTYNQTILLLESRIYLGIIKMTWVPNDYQDNKQIKTKGPSFR